VRYSYEQYRIETMKGETQTDERQDEVTSAHGDKDELSITCRNPLLPNAEITKRYRFAELGDRQRLLDKSFTIRGTPTEKTLVRLTSKTAFHGDFLQNTYYHRIMTAGTMGDPRSVVPAATVAEPIKVRFVFTSEEGWANFAAINKKRDGGIGQYFFKVEDRWVPPKGTTMSYFDVGVEMSENEWDDVDLKPAWWRDFETEVESYAFRKGNAYILTALRHDDQTKDHVLSASIDRMGFSRARDMYVYQFWPRDPDDFPRRGGRQPENWDRLFTKRTCKVIPAGELGDRINVTLPALASKLTCMVVVTQVPGVFCSQEGRETQMLMPTMLGGKIEGTNQGAGNRYSLRVSSPLPAELLVHAQSSTEVVVNGQPREARPVARGDERFVRVSIPQGQSTLDVK